MENNDLQTIQILEIICDSSWKISIENIHVYNRKQLSN